MAEENTLAVKEPKKSRRGLVRFKTNPFLQKVAANTPVGTKRITNKTGDRMMIVSEETGEILAPAGFHEIVEVDKSQFVKLFKNGVSAFKGLTNTGAKVFSVLYDEIQKNPSQDYVYLSFSEINQDTDPMSDRTFFRGIKELLDTKFIAESMTTGKYFVNPDYLWNGNRLAFIKEYRLKSIDSAINSKQKDLFIEQKEEA